MENVPELSNQTVFKDFVKKLEEQQYSVSWSIVYCPDYGIPQTRKRLVLLASRLGDIDLIPPTHNKNNYVTVKDVIGNLPPIEAGKGCSTDTLHRCRSLSSINLQRLEATPYGGSWRDWPKELKIKRR